MGFFIPLVFCVYKVWATRQNRTRIVSHLERRLRELASLPRSAAMGLTPLERSLLVPHPFKPATVSAGKAAVEGSSPDPNPPDPQEGCVICLEDFAVGVQVLTLPCAHVFHAACADKWLEHSAVCPLCKYNLKPLLGEMFEALEESGLAGAGVPVGGTAGSSRGGPGAPHRLTIAQFPVSTRS